MLATCLTLLSGLVCPAQSLPTTVGSCQHIVSNVCSPAQLDPVIDRGWASQYTLGPPGYDLMEATVRLRQSWWPDSPNALPPDLSPWAGFVAGLSCDDIGQTYLIRVLPSKQWRPYLVADCAGDGHSFLWMRDNNILVEFGGKEAAKLGITGLAPSQVEIELIRWPDYRCTVVGNDCWQLPTHWQQCVQPGPLRLRPARPASALPI